MDIDYLVSRNLEQTNITYSMNMVRAKLLYMYYPSKLLPMYSGEHILTALEFFDYKREEIKQWDSVRANMELKKVQESHEIFKNWSPFKFMRFVYNTIFDFTKLFNSEVL